MVSLDEAFGGFVDPSGSGAGIMRLLSYTPSPTGVPYGNICGVAAKRLYRHLKGSKSSTVLRLIPQYPLNLALQVFHLRQDFAFQLRVVGNPGVLGADPADGCI